MTVAAIAYGSDGAVTTTILRLAPPVRTNLDVNRTFAGLTAAHGITLHAATGLGFVAEQTIFAPDFRSLQSTQGVVQ